MRFFNTAGPVSRRKHYCLEPLKRFDLEEILFLIEQEKYFVLHAPRQTGKTSSLLALMEYLNRENNFRCLYVNVEVGQSAQENVESAMAAILSELAGRAKSFLGDEKVGGIVDQTIQRGRMHQALNQVLTLWAEASPLPLVVLLDEVDSLVGVTLISLLRQIRAGYDKRPGSFPQSVLLCGVRDIRDYRMHTGPGKEIITGGSAFNIKAKSLRLGNFTAAEIGTLYAQHTAATGQLFTPAASALAWELTRGQPWLVNALAYEACHEMRAGRDRSKPIDDTMIDQAKENIIQRRETHLDQLADKLKEDRVQRVILPMLTGETGRQEYAPDDVEYLVDLGLLRKEINGAITIANPIYREIIPRHLTWASQTAIPHEQAWYVTPDGRLDMPKLLGAFQEFFREHSEHWRQLGQYQEAGPQLLLQAFLQRIVNATGRVEREYGFGAMRTDLLLIWPRATTPDRIVLELKVAHKGVEAAIKAGLTQTWEYMDRANADEGHLLVFDRAPGKSWEERIFSRREEVHGKSIMVWGM